jgi:Flp pilus assembly protein TadB
MSTLAVAAAAAAAAWLALPGRTALVLPGTTGQTRGGPQPTGERPTRRRLWALLAGVGGWAFAGGAAGIAVGVLAAVTVWVVLTRAEPPAARRRRLRVRADLPHLVGLLAAAVRGGLPPADGLRVVCAALSGPAAESLAALPPRMSLGVDPVEAWRSLEADPSLAPLGRTLSRSARTGEPVAEALDRLGAELAARARSETEDAARRVGVQAAVPLGICLLPAFLLLGIVPVVAGLLGQLLGRS